MTNGRMSAIRDYPLWCLPYRACIELACRLDQETPLGMDYRIFGEKLLEEIPDRIGAFGNRSYRSPTCAIIEEAKKRGYFVSRLEDVFNEMQFDGSDILEYARPEMERHYRNYWNRCSSARQGIENSEQSNCNCNGCQQGTFQQNIIQDRHFDHSRRLTAMFTEGHTSPRSFSHQHSCCPCRSQGTWVGNNQQSGTCYRNHPNHIVESTHDQNNNPTTRQYPLNILGSEFCRAVSHGEEIHYRSNRGMSSMSDNVNIECENTDVKQPFNKVIVSPDDTSVKKPFMRSPPPVNFNRGENRDIDRRVTTDHLSKESPFTSNSVDNSDSTCIKNISSGHQTTSTETVGKQQVFSPNNVYHKNTHTHVLGNRDMICNKESCNTVQCFSCSVPRVAPNTVKSRCQSLQNNTQSQVCNDNAKNISHVSKNKSNIHNVLNQNDDSDVKNVSLSSKNYSNLRNCTPTSNQETELKMQRTQGAKHDKRYGTNISRPLCTRTSEKDHIVNIQQERPQFQCGCNVADSLNTLASPETDQKQVVCSREHIRNYQYQNLKLTNRNIWPAEMETYDRKPVSYNEDRTLSERTNGYTRAEMLKTSNFSHVDASVSYTHPTEKSKKIISQCPSRNSEISYLDGQRVTQSSNDTTDIKTTESCDNCQKRKLPLSIQTRHGFQNPASADEDSHHVNQASSQKCSAGSKPIYVTFDNNDQRYVSHLLQVLENNRFPFSCDYIFISNNQQDIMRCLEQQINEAKVIIMCLSPGYMTNVINFQECGTFTVENLKRIVYKTLHNMYLARGCRNRSVFPILLTESGAVKEHIPTWLENTIVYKHPENIKDLIEHIMNALDIG